MVLFFKLLGIDDHNLILFSFPIFFGCAGISVISHFPYFYIYLIIRSYTYFPIFRLSFWLAKFIKFLRQCHSFSKATGQQYGWFVHPKGKKKKESLIAEFNPVFHGMHEITMKNIILLMNSLCKKH